MTAKNKLYTAPAHPHCGKRDFFVSLRPQQRATGRSKQKNSYKPTPIV
ncbi:unknown [Prevotella sp. CAG:617]|nr:unknown [Prevotella sp. CAG:617]